MRSTGLSGLQPPVEHLCYEWYGIFNLHEFEDLVRCQLVCRGWTDVLRKPTAGARGALQLDSEHCIGDCFHSTHEEQTEVPASAVWSMMKPLTGKRGPVSVIIICRITAGSLVDRVYPCDYLSTDERRPASHSRRNSARPAFSSSLAMLQPQACTKTSKPSERLSCVTIQDDSSIFSCLLCWLSRESAQSKIV